MRGEIDAINRRYTDLMESQNRRLQQLKSVYDANGRAFPVSIINNRGRWGRRRGTGVGGTKNQLSRLQGSATLT